MLTEDQINQNKIRYIELLTHLNIDLTKLTKYLDMERVDFFKKPFTQNNEGAYFGGLCEHALKMYDEVTRLANIYFPGRYSEQDIIIVTLFKDLYKAELFEPYTKKVKNDATNTWDDTLAFRTKESGMRPVFGDVGFSSYMIAKKFIDLDKDDLIEAFCYSSPSSQYDLDIHNIRTDYPLVTLTTMAEFAVQYFKENN